MRVRLRTKSPKEKPARVDRTGHGAILGASIISKGEALGHGFWIDDTTLDQVAALGENAAGRWTHGNLCADGLGTHLGRWKNVRREGDRVLGDFHFSALAKNVQPEGLSVDAPTYLMDAAEKEPDVAGVSAVLELGDFEESDEDEPKKLARVGAMPRADYVADPAANPDGLFGGTPSELADRATFALTEAEAVYGRERVTAFLRAHLGQSQENAVDIEQLKKKHAEEIAAQNAKLAEAEKKTSLAEGKVAELQKAETERQAREDAAYVEALAKKSAEAQAPIDAAKIEKVKAHLAAGRRDIARELGDELLEAALAKGAKGFTTTKAAAPSPAGEQQEGAERGLARLRARNAKHAKNAKRKG